MGYFCVSLIILQLIKTKLYGPYFMEGVKLSQG